MDMSFTFNLPSVITGALVTLLGALVISLVNHRLQRERNRKRLNLDKKEELAVCFIDYYKLIEELYAAFTLGLRQSLSFTDHIKMEDEHIQKRGFPKQHKVNLFIIIYTPKLKYLFDDFIRKADEIGNMKMRYVVNAGSIDPEEFLKLINEKFNFFCKIGDELYEKIIQEIQDAKEKI